MFVRSIMGLVAITSLAGCSIGANLPAANAAIDQFHGSANTGQFDAIYNNATDGFKAAAPKPTFTALMSAIQRKLGHFQSGKSVGWNEVAGTGGHVVNITYQAKYEKGQAVEAFVYAVSDGKVMLQSYNINSPQLIIN